MVSEGTGELSIGGGGEFGAGVRGMSSGLGELPEPIDPDVPELPELLLPRVAEPSESMVPWLAPAPAAPGALEAPAPVEPLLPEP
jgi:hypothetical protein